MPTEAKTVVPLEHMSLEERLVQPTNCQEHWYHLVSRIVRGRCVLDVGAGVPYGLDILRELHPTRLVGIDPLPAGPGVHNLDVTQLCDNSFDITVSLDVIEHVTEDAAFFTQLLRTAKDVVFLTTPNCDYWHCANPHHVREYTAEELLNLIGGREALFWNAGANRFAEPPTPSEHPQASAAGFATLVRAGSCSDASWNRYKEQLASRDLGEWILDRMSRHGIDADEWAHRVKSIKAGAEGLRAAVTAWVDAQSDTDDVLLCAENDDVVNALRHGTMTKKQRAVVLGWAWIVAGVCESIGVIHCESKDDKVKGWMIRDEHGCHYSWTGEFLFKLV